MSEQKNVILAVVCSAAILLGYQYFFEMPRQRAAQEARAQQEAVQAQQHPAADKIPGAAAPGVPAVPGTPAADAAADRAGALAQGQRIAIHTPRLSGSINLHGGRFDDLSLNQYHQTVDKSSPAVTLLSPGGTADGYFAEYGWTASGATVPGPTTDWTTKDTGDLTPDHPVVLTWDNGQGLTFERTIAVDKDFLFTVTQRVMNGSTATVQLTPYARIARHGHPVLTGSYYLHEGPLGLIDGTLNEVSYKDLDKDGSKSFSSTGGWLGITDKYWLVSLVPDQKDHLAITLSHQAPNDLYQTDYAAEAQTLEPGQNLVRTERLFAGAKEIRVLDAYSDSFGIPLFRRAIDFGHLWFVTEPFSWALDHLGHSIGNFGLGILAFTIILRTFMLPLAHKQFASMARMKKLQPQIEELRKRCGDDKQRMSMETMALYKKEGVNPLAGCLPVLVQMPIFISLYKTLYISIEMRHAPFFGWINDLSAPDPTTIFNLFGLIPWTPPSFLHLGVWPILLGGTMWLLQRNQPTPGMDPAQRQVMMLMPVMFTFIMGSLPAGLVIYYVCSNLFSVAQQTILTRRMNAKTA